MGVCLETSFPHPHQRIVTSGNIWKQSSKLRNRRHFRDHLHNHTCGQGATTAVTGDFAYFSTSFLSPWHSLESPDSLSWGISQTQLACGPVYEGITLVGNISTRPLWLTSYLGRKPLTELRKLVKHEQVNIWVKEAGHNPARSVSLRLLLQVLALLPALTSLSHGLSYKLK